MSKHVEWESREALGQALHSLRMSGTFYCRSELTEPWGLRMPPMEGCLWFHAVTSGRVTLDGRGVPLTRLEKGDFALVPHGRGHTLRGQGRAPTPDVTELEQALVGERYSMLRHGGGGAATTLVCGVVRFDSPAASDLVGLLPAVLQLPATEAMESVLRLMAAEARSVEPGGETVTTRLADILVIQSLRAWLARTEASQTGWLGALRDAQLGRALALVHRQPAREWTLGALAAASAMSRSAFALRFRTLVGEPPMKYLARLRVRAAAQLLQEGGQTVSAVSSQLGYQSEAAFSRAFKRVLGVSPGAFKRRR